VLSSRIQLDLSAFTASRNKCCLTTSRGSAGEEVPAAGEVRKYSRKKNLDRPSDWWKSLSRQEACDGDIAETVGEHASTISERMRRLRDAGLVASKRDGKHKCYPVADSQIATLVLNSLFHATEDEFDN
jgi:DNA-binding transcriptional ArsR family regulator